MSDTHTIGELSDDEVMRFLDEALTGADEAGRTREQIQSAINELADIKLNAAMWHGWETGAVRLGIAENGELLFILNDREEQR